MKLIVVYDQVLSDKVRKNIQAEVDEFLENIEVSSLILSGAPRILVIKEESDEEL